MFALICNALANKNTSLKLLKFLYLIGYMSMCVLCSYIYLLRHATSYSQILEAGKLSGNELKRIIASRGLIAGEQLSNEQAQSLVVASGIILSPLFFISKTNPFNLNEK